MSDTPRNLTRNQLAEFLPNQRAVRVFEQMLKQINELLPADVVTLNRLIQETSIEASYGSAKAQSALELLGQVAQDAAINAGTADTKATAALDLLSRMATALETIAQMPVPREDTFLRGDYIDLPVSGPHVIQERRIQWNTDDGTLDVGLFNGVVLQVGQELHFYAKNTSGVTITNGSSVMATGALGASGKITVAKAVADGSVAGEYMIGIATQDIANNAFGYVTSFGQVRGIDTSGTPYGEVWADGNLIYFNPAIVGGLTKVAPAAPKLRAPVAIVINASSGGSGALFVRMKTGEDLAHLNDVTITAPASGQVLAYDGAIWKNTALGSASLLIADTDTTLAANSDLRVATQKATKAYIDNAVLGLLDLKGGTDCSANPNYPVALKGDAYYVTVAGKIGGASGVSVDVGDMYVASADNAGGTQAAVGTSWFLLEHNLTGALLAANNLSDLANAATARTNLGLGDVENKTFAVGVADATHAATSKATPVNADELPLSDSAASFAIKKLTWANVKATLKTYFDTLYQPLSATLTSWAGKTVPTGTVVGTTDSQALSDKSYSGSTVSLTAECDAGTFVMARNGQFKNNNNTTSITALSTWTSLGVGTLGGLYVFRDGSLGGQAVFVAESSAGAVSIYNGITGFQMRWSGTQMEIQVTSGAASRAIRWAVLSSN